MLTTMDESPKAELPKDISPEGERAESETGAALSLGEKMAVAKSNRFLPVSILIAAALIAGSVLFSAFYRPGASAPAEVGGTGGTGAVPGNSSGAAMKIGPRDEILGNPNAPVTIVEYGDYQCPFCGAFFSQTQPQIADNYVNKGVVRMVFRNFAFLGPESIVSAEAAECAFDQKKLVAYHDALYQAKVDDDARGGGENDGSLNRALFISIARKLGLDASAFTSCLDSNKYAALVAQEKTDAGSLGVNSTPSFFVNGTLIVGAQPYAVFQSAIDAAVKG